MRLHHHTTVTVAVSALLYLFFKSWALALASFISGLLVDLDHIYDYLREHGRPFRIKNFFRVCHQSDFIRIVLPLHGWEWLLLSLLTAWISGWNPWTTGILIGLTQHMVLDALHNSPGFWSYSLIWRWKQRFDYDTIFGARLPRLTDRG